MCQMSKIVLVGRMPHWSAVSMVWNHGKDYIEYRNNDLSIDISAHMINP